MVTVPLNNSWFHWYHFVYNNGKRKKGRQMVLVGCIYIYICIYILATCYVTTCSNKNGTGYWRDTRLYIKRYLICGKSGCNRAWHLHILPTEDNSIETGKRIVLRVTINVITTSLISLIDLTRKLIIIAFLYL